MKRLSKETAYVGIALGMITAVLAGVLCVTDDIKAADKVVTIRGSTTVLPIAQNAAEIYMDRHDDVDISVQGGGSGVGVASIIDGTCDIADSSRAVKKSEIQEAADKGVDLKANVIAMDGIAVIVHPSNPLDKISKDQIKGIYTGKISNWVDVGGNDGKIIVVSRDIASGTFEAFNELALDKEKVRPDALMQASNQGVATIISKTPASIGYVGLGYLSSRVKALKVDEVAAGKETVLSKEYALARPLYMYTKGEPRGVVKEFIGFILSEEGQKLVEELGFIGVQ